MIDEDSRPQSLIDRGQIALELYQLELDFNFAKVEYVEQLMEVYEHIYDPLESTRMLQAIVDVMAARPRIHTDARMYVDSYKIET